MPSTLQELKAKLLCEGLRPDKECAIIFESQNPSKVKRGGLSSGAKFLLDDRLPVNAPFYKQRTTDLCAKAISENEISIIYKGEIPLCNATVLKPPNWYDQSIDDLKITTIFTAHNRQLAASVYEDCALFTKKEQCQFCVINNSLKDKDSRLLKKSAALFLEALSLIPKDSYDGITLNGGMTFSDGRGMELMLPIVKAIRDNYPDVQIAVEMTPPKDPVWIKKIVDAGVSSLMMNLEIWDDSLREQKIPGKNKYCSKQDYLKAFKKAVSLLGPGKVSTCFVVGTESLTSLKDGISQVINLGVIPSPLAGRYFEDIEDYPFTPDVDYLDFLDVLKHTKDNLYKKGLKTLDRAGCVACGMCDMIKDYQK